MVRPTLPSSPVDSSIASSFLDSLWNSPPVPGGQTRPALRTRMLRLGMARVCVAVTFVGMAASTGIALLINLFLHRTPHDLFASLVTSAVIPALIAPPVTWLAMRLLMEAEAARGAAERMAVIDPLTGAFNRRHFFIAGERRFARSQRLQEQVSVLLLDVDDFKAVNDQHGHAVGDRVLVDIAQACMGCMREADLMARYGGEEFVALLPATDLVRALQVAERMRTTVAALRIVTDNGSVVRPTVSVGVAMLADTPDSLDALLAQADSAMYSAKRGGKNRVGAGANAAL